MDDDVEGDDPDDGDEIVEELMDGTNTRSWDDFDISCEVVASPIVIDLSISLEYFCERQYLKHYVGFNMYITNTHY